MSLFGSLLGDTEDNSLFGNHFTMMREMNNMMNSLFSVGDPFSSMGALDYDNPHRSLHHSLMPFSMPIMPNFNRLLSNSLDSLGGHSYSSSTVVSMTSGPDGRPQVYKATSSTRTAPGGVKETQKSVTDTRSGTKKMAIGHHIGDRAHIIEKEHNMHTGDQEERQDFINLDEDEADDFNKEWETKARNRSEIPRITTGTNPYHQQQQHHHHHHRHHYSQHHHRGNSAAIAGTTAAVGNNSGLLAITGGSSNKRRHRPLVTSRNRRNSLNLSSTSSSRTPYSLPGQPKRNKNIKTVSGPSTD